MLNPIDAKEYNERSVYYDVILRSRIEEHISSKSYKMIIKTTADMELHNISNNPVNLITSYDPHVGAIVTPEQHTTVLYASGIPKIEDMMYVGLYTVPSSITYLTNTIEENIQQFSPSIISFTEKPKQLSAPKIDDIVKNTLNRIVQMPTTQSTHHKECLKCKQAVSTATSTIKLLSSGRQVAQAEVSNALSKLTNKCTQTAYQTTTQIPLSTIDEDTIQALASLNEEKVRRKRGRPAAKKTTHIAVKRATERAVTRSATKKAAETAKWKRFGVKSPGCL